MHILAAVVLLGGTFFLRFALLPAVESLTSDTRQSFQAAWRRRWAMLVMMTSALLLISGLTNFILINRQYEFAGGMYHGLLGIKFLLALAIFWVSAVLSGRSALADKFRERMSFWLNLNVVLAILLVCVAGWMKATDREPKPAADGSSDRVALPLSQK
jgi:uncharacterized membrane protein